MPYRRKRKRSYGFRRRLRRHGRRHSLKSRHSRFRRRKRGRSAYVGQRSKGMVRLGRSRTRTLSQRVKRLEYPTKKHFDLVRIVGGLNEPRKFRINWWGCDYFDGSQAPGTASGLVLSEWLSIEPRSQSNDIGTFSGNFIADQLNTRVNDRVFVKGAKITGRLACPFPERVLDESALPSATDMIPDANIAALSSCSIWMVVLRDNRPSLTDVQGQMTPNPDAFSDSGDNTGPLEANFQIMNAGGAGQMNTLKALGMNGGLRSYTKSRYTIVHKRRFNLSQARPFLDFSVYVKLNKYLRYDVQRPGLTPPAPAPSSVAGPPLVNRYCISFCSNWEQSTSVPLGDC